jgi:hypothetical protein
MRRTTGSLGVRRTAGAADDRHNYAVDRRSRRAWFGTHDWRSPKCTQRLAGRWPVLPVKRSSRTAGRPVPPPAFARLTCVPQIAGADSCAVERQSPPATIRSMALSWRSGLWRRPVSMNPALDQRLARGRKSVRYPLHCLRRAWSAFARSDPGRSVACPQPHQCRPFRLADRRHGQARLAQHCHPGEFRLGPHDPQGDRAG